MPVEVDEEALASLGLEVVAANLVHESTAVRHNPDAVAAIALRLAQKGRQKRLERAKGNAVHLE